MAPSTKAVLLSFFVFPGAGHFFLKKYSRACILTGAALISVYIILSGTIKMAQQISEKIQRDCGEVNVAEIVELISQQPQGIDYDSINFATTVLIIVWLVATFDAYRIGRYTAKK